MKLSVLVPVYNEERTLEEVVGRVCAFPIAKEIILVDDGSKDRSREILERLAAGEQSGQRSAQSDQSVFSAAQPR